MSSTLKKQHPKRDFEISHLFSFVMMPLIVIIIMFDNDH